MAAPTDTATPPANTQVAPAGQGQSTGAASDPMAQYSMLEERAQELLSVMEDPRLKMDAEQAEFVRQYNEISVNTNKQMDDKREAAAKKKGTMGLLGSVLGGAAIAAGTFFFSRKKGDNRLIKWGAPAAGLGVGGILGGIIGTKMGGNAQAQLSADQQTVISAANESIAKLCDTFEQKLIDRVQQLIASGALQGRLDVSGQSPASAPVGNAQVYTAADLQQLAGQSMPGQGMPGQQAFDSSSVSSSSASMMPSQPMDMTGMMSGQRPGDGSSMQTMMPSQPMNMTGMTSGQRPSDGSSMQVTMPTQPMNMAGMTSGQRPGDGSSMQMMQGSSAQPNANVSDPSAEQVFPGVRVGSPT